MKYPLFFEHFRSQVNLSEEAYEDIESRIISKKISKREHLIKAGRTIRYLPFINKGLMVNYRLDDSGHKYVIQIRYTGTWLGDLVSFFSHQPSKFYIQAFQDTELLLINRETYADISAKYPIIEKSMRISIQNAYDHTLNRIFGIHSKSAKERYQELTHHVPSIMDDMPHYMIASYLGIKPQSLSRIRND